MAGMTAIVSMITPITAVIEGEWVMSCPNSYHVSNVKKMMAGYMFRAHLGQARSSPNCLTLDRMDIEVIQEEIASHGHMAQKTVPPPATRKINKAHHQVQVRVVAMFKFGFPKSPAEMTNRKNPRKTD